MKQRNGANGRVHSPLGFARGEPSCGGRASLGWARDERVAVAHGAPGGLGCVASKGFAEARFRICGNDWGYGRNFGSVANEGVRRNGAGETVRQNVSGVRSAWAGMMANYQIVCYHTRTVPVKINY